MFINTLKESGAEFNQAFSVHENTDTYWYPSRARAKAGVRTSTGSVVTNIRAIHEPFILDCYHGGQNECYAFCPTSKAIWNFDLAGAYINGVVDMRHIDYDRVPGACYDASDGIAQYLGTTLSATRSGKISGSEAIHTSDITLPCR